MCLDQISDLDPAKTKEGLDIDESVIGHIGYWTDGLLEANVPNSQCVTTQLGSLAT